LLNNFIYFLRFTDLFFLKKFNRQPNYFRELTICRKNFFELNDSFFCLLHFPDFLILSAGMFIVHFSIIHFKFFTMPDNNQKRVAIITENGFEEVELTSPKKQMENAGIKVDILSTETGTVKAWNHDHWSIELPVDKNLADANPFDYDALMIPGGVINPDKMRINKTYINFAKDFMESGKPVAAICHGPQLLIETGLLNGKKMTSYLSIRTDLENAGATWFNKEVVVDTNLITSRSPKDLDAFNEKLLEAIREGVHEEV
jgi:protease I